MSCQLLRALALASLCLQLPAAALAAPLPDASPDTSAATAAALDLEQALGLARARNASLAARRAEIEARAGVATQAALLPNPSLGIVRENLGDTGLTGTEAPATTVEIGQLIELGGKRAARTAAAEHARREAEQELAIEEAVLAATVAERFAEVLAAQERQRLADELLALGERTAAAVAEKVKAGKVVPIEQNRADIALAQVHLQRRQAERALESARRQLAALWGGSPAVEAASGRLGSLPPLPAAEALVARLRESPLLARWATRVEARQAELELARTKAIPDITVSVGVTRFDEFDENTYQIGLSVPLPLFDRNQGGRAEARARLTQAQDERRAALAEAEAALLTAYQSLLSARAEVTTLEEQVLPAAEEVFVAATAAYRAGKFTLLEVLDAQRTLFDARSQYLAALSSFHGRRAELERLLGAPLAAVTQE